MIELNGGYMKRSLILCLVLCLAILSVFSQMIDQAASIVYKGQI
jgi:hypothetical protein